MSLLLLEVASHPGEIAATRRRQAGEGRTFLLDFSRPLRLERWLLVWNFRVGVPMALHVPVVHEGEPAGTRTISVERGDPYFGELQRLWRERFPRTRSAPAVPASASTVAHDFEFHFAAASSAG
jgi:hypothetical protein